MWTPEIDGWNTGTRLIGSDWRWARPVPVHPDELPSSWLVRVALEHGCDPLSLTGAVWPGWRVWTRDPDRGIPKDRVQAFSDASGLRLEHLESFFNRLRQAAARMDIHFLESHSVWRWILPSGSRNRLRHGGLQLCPVCFREVEPAYYRLHWRFAWQVACRAHGCLLVDSCPACASPLEPHRLVAKDMELASCSSCGKSFRNLSIEPATDLILRMQENGELTLCDQAESGSSSSSSWFDDLAEIVTLIRQGSLGGSTQLWERLRELGVSERWREAQSTKLRLEELPTCDRSILLEDSFQVLVNLGGLVTPEKMRYLQSGTRTLPLRGARSQAVHRLMSERQPRSKSSVTRMLMRLIRRMRGNFGQ